jgi:diguanylate cyclase (GGDEF)-like protein
VHQARKLTLFANLLATLHAAATVSHEDAARRLPAVFEATVTYFRGYEKTLFVQDGDDAIRSGSRVLVTDVAVLAPPPWLDVRHLMEIVIGLLGMVLLISLWGAMLRGKVHRQAVEMAKRIEAESTLERSRSRILEAINANRSLSDILAQIGDLVSSMMNGAPCWLQTSIGSPSGKPPDDSLHVQIVRQEIRSRTGHLHGAILVALEPSSKDFLAAIEAVTAGAGLAALAIDTRGLYSSLVHRSEFDLLTDIHNRFSLEKHLDAVLEEGRLHGSCFGVVYIDLDDFKQVNDRFGHHLGDLCLQQVAQRMKRQLRPADLLARLGGDEFATLVTAVRTRADVEEIASRMDHCFDEPFPCEGHTLRIGASVGIAFYPADGLSRDALLCVADAAMYANKHKRRQMAEMARFGAGK